MACRAVKLFVAVVSNFQFLSGFQLVDIMAANEGAKYETFNSFPDSRREGSAIIIVKKVDVFQFLSGFQIHD